ncbi:multiple sugar transport system permease protein [Actinacidiphila alni]|uniref:Multiple sugar transport system permease protein n=1 Tax=Actinacidiphila alni TaxID=380248 RepID=A0A1I1WRJ5_9ACTN|nr:sugar ABC transporter permease [Actinacidiphila alni]SFD97756.1 multiple sugar transport system permease protein [Actinacidiphila alni]
MPLVDTAPSPPAHRGGSGPATAAPPPKAPLRTRLWAARWSYLYILPLLALLLTFVVYPIFGSLVYTFYRWNGIGEPSDFVGLDNFRQIAHDSIFWDSVAHTFVYAIVVVPVQLVIALALALVLNNKKLRFSAFYRTLFFLPVVTSPAVVGVVVQLMLSNFGDTFNSWLLDAHIIDTPVDWLGNPRIAMGIIILVGIWQTLGYNLVYFLAGLQTIPEEINEAARIDGAGPVRTFLHITVPMLRSVGLMIVILAFIGSFQVFDLVQVLTNGGPYFGTEVVNTYIYHLAFGGNQAAATQPDVGLASAASFFYGLLLIGFSVLQVLIFRSIAKRRAAGRG